MIANPSTLDTSKIASNARRASPSDEAWMRNLAISAGRQIANPSMTGDVDLTMPYTAMGNYYNTGLPMGGNAPQYMPQQGNDVDLTMPFVGGASPFSSGNFMGNAMPMQNSGGVAYDASMNYPQAMPQQQAMPQAMSQAMPQYMPQQQMTSNVANTLSNVNSASTSNPAPPPMTQSPAPTTSSIDPAIQPYLGYGLSEAQRLYQAGGPQYYGGQTFVSPSISTQTALQALEARSSLGNPLLQSAQNQLQGTVSGDYLGGNPFFQGAFQPAAKAAESQFKTTLGDIASKSSLAGRYGSGAMGSLQDRATGAFSQSLANTAGQLAYQNYDAERARQQAATLASPAMAGADYQDIQQLINAGQAREAYTGQQQQADIQRFNFLQNQPQQNLQTYLQSIYGNPINKAQQVQDTSPSGLQNLLGTAALLGGVEKNTGWLSSGWNKIFGA